MEPFGQIQWLKLLFLALNYLYSVQPYNRIHNCTEFPIVNSVCSHASGSQFLEKNPKLKNTNIFKMFCLKHHSVTQEKTLDICYKKLPALQGPLLYSANILKLFYFFPLPKKLHML